MNEPEKIDPRELSPLALAFVGDSVLELLVRQRLVEHHRLSAGKLNAEKVKYVSARAQSLCPARPRRWRPGHGGRAGW